MYPMRLLPARTNSRIGISALVTILSLAGCDDSTVTPAPPTPGSVATSIIAKRPAVPVILDPASPRLTFTNIKYEETSGSDRAPTIKLWSEVQRTSSEDNNKTFTLQVTVHFPSGSDQRFKRNVELSRSSIKLDLVQLNELQGSVPDKLIVSIVAEKNDVTQ